jgi:hypothetical protein
MRPHDWGRFVKRDDEKLTEAFTRYTSLGTSDLCVGAAQTEQMYRAFYPPGVQWYPGQRHICGTSSRVGEGRTTCHGRVGCCHRGGPAR